MKWLYHGRLARIALGLVIVITATFAATGGRAIGATSHAASYKVAILSPGTSNDGSWGQDVWGGAVIARKLVSKVVFVDNLNTQDQFQQQGAAFAQKHYNLVIMANYSVPGALFKLSRQFPKTEFVELATAQPNLPKNAATWNLLFQNGDFLAGALAGMITKSNKLGVIGGFSFPALTSEMEGFILGARWVNHNISATETYINSWTDVAAARAAATAQIGTGADLIFSATDQATQGIYAAAQAHPNTYVISQYFDTHSQAPQVALTSVLFNLHGAVGEIIRLGVAGKLTNKNYIYGSNHNVGVLSPFYNLKSVVPAAVQARLLKIQTMLKQGTLRCPFLGTTGQGKSYALGKLPAPPK
jgi:basic membrane protein A